MEQDEIGKGYEFEKGQYVLFTDEELQAVSEQATKAIEITEFVPLEKVDPLFYEKTYYVGPDEGGGTPGEVLALKPLRVACGNGSIVLERIKPEGRGEQPAEAFLAGNDVKIGQRLGASR